MKHILFLFSTLVLLESSLVGADPSDQEDFSFNYNDFSVPNPFTEDQSEDFVSIVATTGSTIITNHDIKERARVITEGRYDSLSTDAGLAVRQAALQGLIDDTIILLHTEKGRLKSPLPKSDHAFMKYIIDTYGLPSTHFSDLASKFGVSLNHVIRMHKAEILWRGACARDLEDFQERQSSLKKASFSERELLLEEIVVPNTIPIENLRDSLNKALSEGVSFGQLATGLSYSPSVFQSGHIGWIPESALDQESKEIIEQTPLGGVTPIIERGRYFHVYRVVGRRSAQNASDIPWFYTTITLSLPLASSPEAQMRQIEHLKMMRMSVRSGAELKSMAEQSAAASFEVHTKASVEKFTKAQQKALSSMKTQTLSPIILDTERQQAHLIFLEDATQSNEEKESTSAQIDFAAVMRRLKIMLRMHTHVEVHIKD